MSVHDAQPGDIYTDAFGDVWAVVSIIQEPSVTVERIWPTDDKPDRQRLSGGVSGLMWNGFKRIARTRVPK